MSELDHLGAAAAALEQEQEKPPGFNPERAASMGGDVVDKAAFGKDLAVPVKLFFDAILPHWGVTEVETENLTVAWVDVINKYSLGDKYKEEITAGLVTLLFVLPRIVRKQVKNKDEKV